MQQKKCSLPRPEPKSTMIKFSYQINTTKVENEEQQNAFLKYVDFSGQIMLLLYKNAANNNFSVHSLVDWEKSFFCKDRSFYLSTS